MTRKKSVQSASSVVIRDSDDEKRAFTGSRIRSRKNLHEEEIHHRCHEIDEAQVQLITAEDAFDQLQKKYR